MIAAALILAALYVYVLYRLWAASKVKVAPKPVSNFAAYVDYSVGGGGDSAP